MFQNRLAHVKNDILEELMTKCDIMVLMVTLEYFRFQVFVLVFGSADRKAVTNRACPKRGLRDSRIRIK